MLSTLLTIFLAPFLPVFLYGNILPVDGEKINIPLENTGLVMGEQKEQTGESFEKYNFFPVENYRETDSLPVKKTDASEPKIWATSSVVIDAKSGTLLHYDAGRKQTQIASLTKIMTAILTMEKINNLNEETTITEAATCLPGTVVGCPTTGYCLSNRMYLGEKVRVLDLLKAMLMNSANDAATALAVHIAGSPEKFVALMNDKAKELGLKDTHFCTPSGLEIDGEENACYSSAYDIARIAAYSLRYEKIWEIMRIPEDKFFSSNGKYMHELKNTDLLLTELPGCIGGKTGFTPLAGKSLLTGATDASGKNKIIAVILNDETRWQDMKTLINWTFANYQWQ
jgi:serine-type D-Ala-D-Ala carboxypeptidase (penicillin-binding protein 5/6)